MGKRLRASAATAALLFLLGGCKTGGMGDDVVSAGETLVEGAADAGKAVAGAAGGIPSLVNVNLKDVLNDLSLDLNLDRANIPVNAQVPITVAANICGVSINILSVSTGGQANCTATTTSPELAQVVQQQIAAGGSVGGGAQGGSTAGTSSTTATGGTSASGSTGTGAQSTGSSQTTQPAATTTTGTTQPAPDGGATTGAATSDPTEPRA